MEIGLRKIGTYEKEKINGIANTLSPKFRSEIAMWPFSKSIRARIRDFEEVRKSKSYESLDYKRLTKEIEILALQLPKTSHTTEIIIGILIAVTAGLLLFYVFGIR